MWKICFISPIDGSIKESGHKKKYSSYKEAYTKSVHLTSLCATFSGGDDLCKLVYIPQISHSLPNDY